MLKAISYGIEPKIITGTMKVSLMQMIEECKSEFKPNSKEEFEEAKIRAKTLKDVLKVVFSLEKEINEIEKEKHVIDNEFRKFLTR